ncbi:hypothetical protein HPP92_028163 [Vanilla planifolia]|uniref:Uncharacterized protein n=1 Tax=Vanilla planifolia TaxID=51239 RepID=A0A835U3S3_VANPL|nr:hypothetical protein HPP92_028163 [Vanilla planifolia]
MLLSFSFYCSDNDGIFGNWNKRAQETVKSTESTASDYNKRREVANHSSTHRAATSTESSHLNSKIISCKRTIPAKRQTITLSTHNHLKASVDTAVVKQSLQAGMQTPLRESYSETGDGNGYPKIKCKQLNQLKPRKKAGK